jgi:hypothetical protein
VAQDRPDQDKSRGVILTFRPRRASAPPRAGWPHTTGELGPSPIEDLTKYEHVDDGDDYRHRMRMNAVSIVVLTLLVVIGVWIANTMAEMQKKQDCVLQGRRNCAPIDVPSSSGN